METSDLKIAIGWNLSAKDKKSKYIVAGGSLILVPIYSFEDFHQV